MNTDVAAWLWAEPGPADIWLPEVERFFGEVESELSRFRPDSGLSRLNAAAGLGPQPVSPMLAEVLRLAVQTWESTSGVFDPTVLPALRAAGYDRSFEMVREGPNVVAKNEARVALGQELDGAAAGIEVDRFQKTVSLRAGVQIDLGGIAKGWTVDRAAEMLGAWGAALVDAGGDLRSSAAPGGAPWPIAVDDPFHPGADLAMVRVGAGAVATSTTLRRRWSSGGQEMHHLIDPRTCRPSESELVSVSVLAPTTVRAETAAKVALILGRNAGRARIGREGLAALLVDRDGQVEIVGNGQFELIRSM